MNHLAKFLGHDPSIAELTSLNLNGTFAMLVKNGRQRTTVDRVRRNLLAIALEAHQHEVLAERDRFGPSQNEAGSKIPVDAVESCRIRIDVRIGSNRSR